MGKCVTFLITSTSKSDTKIMEDQQNPFKQFLPEEFPPQQQLSEEVMGNIRMNSFLMNILEFFLAILGITFVGSFVPAPDNDTAPGDAREGLK